MTYQIKELLLDDGMCPFAKWFGSLEAVTERQQRDIDQAVALWEDHMHRKASTRKGGK